MPSVLCLAALACSGLGLILQITGLATNVWTTNTVHEGQIQGDFVTGLWKYCTPRICFDVDHFFQLYGMDRPGWYETCRAFGISGVVALIGCLVTGVAEAFLQLSKLPLLAATLGLAGGVSILIEFTIFCEEIDSGVSFGYSLYLTILAFILALAAGILFFLTSRKAQ